VCLAGHRETPKHGCHPKGCGMTLVVRTRAMDGYAGNHMQALAGCPIPSLVHMQHA
jgi:hypothetical protein